MIAPTAALAKPAAPEPAMPAASDASPPASEGPISTASLSPAAPPARPSETPGIAGAAARGALKTSAAAPVECLPESLRSVLNDVAARFGPVTVVSTHQLTTVNHSSGSIREKLHHACKAVDIRPDPKRIEEIKTYLRGRREIVGIESYRNGIIHMDVSGGLVAGAPAPLRAARRRPAEAAPGEALEAAPRPKAAEAPSASLWRERNQ